MHDNTRLRLLAAELQTASGLCLSAVHETEPKKKLVLITDAEEVASNSQRVLVAFLDAAKGVR